MAGLAACPDAATLTAVAEQAAGDFARAPPPAGTAVVLQLLTADFVVTVCRDGDGAYWYFSRGGRRTPSNWACSPGTGGRGRHRRPLPATDR
ncbi:MAG: hypothetical protein R2749_03665 [Acidimicrobiales bacterium]